MTRDEVRLRFRSSFDVVVLPLAMPSRYTGPAMDLANLRALGMRSVDATRACGWRAFLGTLYSYGLLNGEHMRRRSYPGGSWSLGAPFSGHRKQASGKCDRTPLAATSADIVSIV